MCNKLDSSFSCYSWSMHFYYWGPKWKLVKRACEKLSESRGGKEQKDKYLKPVGLDRGQKAASEKQRDFRKNYCGLKESMGIRKKGRI